MNRQSETSNTGQQIESLVQTAAPLLMLGGSAIAGAMSDGGGGESGGTAALETAYEYTDDVDTGPEGEEPWIRLLSPATGSIHGGTLVTVYGYNFSVRVPTLSDTSS